MHGVSSKLQAPRDRNHSPCRSPYGPYGCEVASSGPVTKVSDMNVRTRGQPSVQHVSERYHELESTVQKRANRKKRRSKRRDLRCLSCKIVQQRPMEFSLIIRALVTFPDGRE
jgi:hypothetical protein